MHINCICKVKDQFGYFDEQNTDEFLKNTVFAFLRCKEFDKLKQFSEYFPEFYSDTVNKLSSKTENYQKYELKKRHQQNKWRKLCGRIVKQHKTTYYFLYIPIVRIKRSV